MKNLGIMLVALGVLALAYGGFRYSQSRTILKVGSVSLTAGGHKNIPVPVFAGAGVLIGGIAVLLVGQRRS